MIDVDVIEHGAVQRAGDDAARLAHLEDEVRRLEKRCRAHENALAKMAGAVQTLRDANRALNDENVLLRQQVAELTHRPSRPTRRRWELGAPALG